MQHEQYDNLNWFPTRIHHWLDSIRQSVFSEFEDDEEGHTDAGDPIVTHVHCDDHFDSDFSDPFFNEEEPAIHLNHTAKTNTVSAIIESEEEELNHGGNRGKKYLSYSRRFAMHHGREGKDRSRQPSMLRAEMMSYSDDECGAIIREHLQPVRDNGGMKASYGACNPGGAESNGEVGTSMMGPQPILTDYFSNGRTSNNNAKGSPAHGAVSHSRRVRPLKDNDRSSPLSGLFDLNSCAQQYSGLVGVSPFSKSGKILKNSPSTGLRLFQADHPLSGMAMAVMSAVMYSVLGMSVKALNLRNDENQSWIQVLVVRIAVSWLISVIWLYYLTVVTNPDRNANVWTLYYTMMAEGRPRIWMFVRSVCLFGALVCSYYSFEYLCVSDGIALTMTFPLWVCLMSAVIYRSNPGGSNLDTFGWVMTLIGAIGVLLIARPSFLGGVFGQSSKLDTLAFAHHHQSHSDLITKNNHLSSEQRWIGVGFGIGSALLSAVQYLLVHQCRSEVHWLQMEQFSLLVSLSVLMPILWTSMFVSECGGFHKMRSMSHSDMFSIVTQRLWLPMSAFDWIIETLAGAVGFAALACLTRASQLGSPARTSLCSLFQIPVSLMIASVITRSIPALWEIIGVFLVLFAVCIPAVRRLKEAHLIAISTNVTGVSGERQPLLISHDHSKRRRNGNPGQNVAKYISFLPPPMAESIYSSAVSEISSVDCYDVNRGGYQNNGKPIKVTQFSMNSTTMTDDENMLDDDTQRDHAEDAPLFGIW